LVGIWRVLVSWGSDAPAGVAARRTYDRTTRAGAKQRSTCERKRLNHEEPKNTKKARQVFLRFDFFVFFAPFFVFFV
jgi:hypothetical protein